MSVVKPTGHEVVRSGDVLQLPVLVVNRYLQPVQVTSVRRAMMLLFGGVALAVDEAGELLDFPSWRRMPVRPEDDHIPVITGSVRAPRVVHLRRYDRMRHPVVRLCRKNIMLRDGHQCQYCSLRLMTQDMNIDHVMPKSRGGAESWENLVTACKRCNLVKGRRTPEEAGMRLLRRPSAPRWSLSTQILLSQPDPFHEWAPFLKAG